jgi:hypothetical protein
VPVPNNPPDELDLGDAVITEVEQGSTGIEEEDLGPEEAITEPFDPTLIRVATNALTIDLLTARLREKEIELAPDFQRMGGIWSDVAQSRLIESILIKIPLPALYLDATDEDRWIVVDGLQRLTALKRFAITKELRLTGLEFLNLNGKSFSELPRNLQRRIMETQIVVYLIERGTPPAVKFNIFKRINTGGLPLSPQEIRHALNQGTATRVLADLARSQEFKMATANGIKDRRMADRECILRYFAFRIRPYSSYKGKDLDGFLNQAMVALNAMSDSEVSDLVSDFKRAMLLAYKIFGRDAFRKRYSAQQARYPLNKALFEVWSVNLSQISAPDSAEIVIRREQLKTGFMALMNTDEFDRSISTSTGDPARIRERFSAVERLIRVVLS